MAGMVAETPNMTNQPEKIVVSESDGEFESDHEEMTPDDNPDEVMYQKSDNVGPRVRQYGSENKGPFIVFVRTNKKDQPLESLMLTRFVRAKYTKSAIEVQQVNKDKIKVVFGPKGSIPKAIDDARNEANDFPKCVWNKKFSIYIPELSVESIGVINYCVTESVHEIVKHGYGKFENPKMPKVTIIEASRFTKAADEASNAPSRIRIGLVRVIFEGQLLPNYVILDGMKIPVRMFRRRKMFCDTCQRYNHTSSHCVNKPQVVTGGVFKCNKCKSNDHEAGDKTCPQRKVLEKRENANIKKAQQKTYAEMLQHYDPQAKMPGEKEEDQYNLVFPIIGSKRSRNKAPTTSSPLRKFQRDNSNQRIAKEKEKNERNPPGFRYQHEQQQENVEEDDITIFLKSFVNDLGLPAFITQLIIKFVIPIVHKLVTQITNSISEKIQQATQ